MAGILSRMGLLTQPSAKAIRNPEINDRGGEHQQLRCAPQLPGGHAENPGDSEHRGHDTDHPGGQTRLAFSPVGQLRRANSYCNIFSHGREAFSKPQARA